MHRMDPPTGFKGKFWKDEDGHFIRREDGGFDVQNNPESIGYYKEIEPVMVRGKKASTTLIEKVDKAASSIGIVAELNEALMGKQTKGTIGKYVKVLGTIGKVTGIVSVASSGYEFIKNSTWQNGVKLGISVLSTTKYINPALGVAISIFDMAGGTDYVLDIFGK